MRSRERRPVTPRRRLSIGMFLGAVAAAALAGATIAADGGGVTGRRCEGVEFAAPPLTADRDLDLEFVLQKLTLDFGDSHGTRTRTVVIEVAPAAASEQSLNNLEGLHLRVGGNEELEGPSGHFIRAEGDGLDKTLLYESPNVLRMCVSVTPGDVVSFGPGRYSGTIGVFYGLTNEVRDSVPVEVTFRASRWSAMLVAALGLVLGLTVKALSEATWIHRRTGAGGAAALREYMSQPAFWATVIVAVVAAVFSFFLLYRADPDWGASDSDWLRLFATCFLLQMSGSEALTMLGRIAGGAMPPQPPGADPGT
jgi:hypothetical protein